MKHIIFFSLLLVCAGCKTVAPISQTTSNMSREERDSSHVAKDIKRDSVFVHDSVFVIQKMKNDTVLIEKNKFKTIYKDREVIKVDTVRVTCLKTDTVVTERVETVTSCPKFYSTCTWLFWILVVGILGVVGVRLYLRFHGLK